MNRDDFLEAVKIGDIQSVYLFAGAEEWTKREAVAALRDKLLPVGLEQLNETVLDGASAQKIIDCAETLPVMCERRLVIVRDWNALKAQKNENDEADAAGDLKRILDWMRNAPDTCTILFYMSAAWNGGINRKLTAKGSPVVRVDFDYLSEAALLKWCSRELAESNKRINVHAVQKMTEMIGSDLTRIHAELGKLAAYIGERPEITADDVAAIVSPSIEYKVYLIAENLLKGKLIEATEAVNSALQSTNAASVISLLLSQFRRFLYYKYVQNGKLTDADAIRDLNMDPKKNTSYILRQNKSLVRSIDAENLKCCYMLCVDADYSIKSGAARDRTALDYTMLRIVQLATK